MSDLLQQETERQRRLLEEARKAVEQEKVRMRQGGVRRIEPSLDETPAMPIPQQGEFREDGRQDYALPLPGDEEMPPPAEFIVPLRSVPDMRSALIPLDDDADGAIWSKPFSLPSADMEPWLSFLRGYRASALFPEQASAGSGLRVDAAVQALLELKGIDIKVILEPAVQINGPVEYAEDVPAQAISGNEHSVHESQLAKAFEKGREMGDHLYDALLGEGYVNLVQAWEKVHSRKPSVSELHFMLTTGRVKPSEEIQPRRPEMVENLYPPKAPVVVAETAPRKQEVVSLENSVSMPKAGFLRRISTGLIGGKLKAKFAIRDKRKLIFHLSHLALVGVAIVVYCIVMRVFD
ncbi:MAG TPA: hypothetical protein VJ652_02640 [Noviherbaspirillum sp.]|nr:hypothetical protein [Noviherbaspirillum sp.]